MINLFNELPKSWSDITVEQYQELFLLNEDDFNGEFDLILEQLAIILNTSSDDDEFDELDIDDLISLMSKIKWLKLDINKNNKLIIDNLHCKDFNKLTLGEFIDLEHFFGLNYIENLHIICAIIYKQQSIDQWNNVIEEPYRYDIYERSNKFLEYSIEDVYAIIKKYLDWKQNLMDIYGTLFEDPNFDKIENEEAFDVEELLEMKQEIEEDKKKSKWSWEAIVYDLANNDITKFNDVFDTQLILVLNTLSMKKTLGL
jgi:hypothetical protein